VPNAFFAPAPTPSWLSATAAVLGALLALFVTASSPPAAAQPAAASTTASAAAAIDGKWRQSALREDYTVQQWQSSCGPAPTSTSSGGGDVATVKLEGDELVILGGGRVFRSNQCYDPMPTLARDAHSRDPSGRSWRTRCSTPAGDPRRATLQTLVTVSSTRIEIAETGRYEVTVNDGHCVADVKRNRSLALVSLDAAPPAPTATATATAAPSETVAPPDPPAPGRCASPGPPSKLEVRPSRKLLRLGDTFAFRAQVTDDKGCATGTEPVWSVDKERGLEVDARGKVRVGEGAKEGETEITVSAAGQKVKVVVEVTSPQKYDDLLKQSGLNAEGESDQASSVNIPGTAIDSREVQAQDASRRRRLVFGAVVFGLAVSLAAVYLLLTRRSRARTKAAEKEAEALYEERKREADLRRNERLQSHEAQQRAHEESKRHAAERAAARAAQARAPGAAVASTAATTAGGEPLVCPICEREFARPFQHCPHDGATLVARSPAGRSGKGGVCPVCNRGFDGVRVCPEHGEELLPAALAAGHGAAQMGTKRGKICPTCGDRFEGNATFCGKDGTALVLVN
jgi:hypothetical protein